MTVSRSNRVVTVGKLTLVDFLVCLVLPVLSQFSSYLQDTAGINTSILALVFILCAFVSAAYRGARIVCIPSGMLIGAFVVSVVCMNALVNGSDIVNAMKPMLLVAFVFVVGPMISPSGIKLFMGVVIAMSAVITVDVFTNIEQYASAGLNLYNVRQSTMVDKPGYTILYALSITLVIACFHKLHTNNGRIAAIALVAAEVYVGFSVIESKTFLFAVVLATTVFYVISARMGKSNVLIPLVVVMLASLLILLLYSNPELIPDSVRSLLNNLFGIDISYSDRYEGSYVSRSLIASMALSRFSQRPVIGIGFGNFSATFVWSGTEYTIGQTESSWLSFLVEGGVVYFLIHIILNVYLAVRLYRCAVFNQNRTAAALLLMLIVFAALNVVNDFATNLYWCVLAIAYGLVYRDTGSVRNSRECRTIQRNCINVEQRGSNGSYQ